MIDRGTLYAFHARGASCWRSSCIFLAGDATPGPVRRTGMNTCFRDALNLRPGRGVRVRAACWFARPIHRGEAPSRPTACLSLLGTPSVAVSPVPPSPWLWETPHEQDHDSRVPGSFRHYADGDLSMPANSLAITSWIARLSISAARICRTTSSQPVPRSARLPRSLHGEVALHPLLAPARARDRLAGYGRGETILEAIGRRFRCYRNCRQLNWARSGRFSG